MTPVVAIPSRKSSIKIYFQLTSHQGGGLPMKLGGMSPMWFLFCCSIGAGSLVFQSSSIDCLRNLILFRWWSTNPYMISLQPQSLKTEHKKSSHLLLFNIRDGEGVIKSHNSLNPLINAQRMKVMDSKLPRWVPPEKLHRGTDKQQMMEGFKSHSTQVASSRWVA